MWRFGWKLFLSFAILLLAVLAWRGVVDDLGRDYTQAGLARALLTFGVARGLNGVISVAQGTEVAIEPVGIGVVLAPGQILDPVNDLVERFSWIMLASATSLGMQKVVLEIMAWPGLTLVLGGLLAAALILLWWPQPVAEGVARTIYRLALTLLILRFAIPLIAIGSELLYGVFLEPQYRDSRARLERTVDAIGDMNREALPPADAGSESSWLDSARRAYATATDAMNVERRLDAFRQTAAEVSEHAINLIVVFVLQTIVFPLLFLWLMLQAVKAAIRAPFRAGRRE
jgi:hypothetical protein